MRHIQKVAEPQELVDFKKGDSDWVPTWAALESKPHVKRAMNAALLREQGAICCYCESRISADRSHIEHLLPRSKDKKAQHHLEWSNLCASCNSPKEPEEKTHCGQAKKDWYDRTKFVSPLDPGCQSRFRFVLSGDIEPADKNDAAATETIKRLRLNHKRLVCLRKAAIEAALPDEEDSDECVDRLIESFSQLDSNGELSEFVSAILSQLSQYQSNAARRSLTESSAS